MAEDPEMRREVFLVSGALSKFAKEKGWKDSDYWIYYKPNPDWGRVYFVFVAEPLNDQDLYAATTEVWSYLQKELAEVPDVLKSLGLVVRSKKKVDEGGLYSIGPSFREYWTIYPMPTT
jgi:hypothetical protein